MKLVIDIDEREYKIALKRKENFPRDLSRFESIIANGEPLIESDEEKGVEPHECNTCKFGRNYENGYDTTTMDDECGGCCSWNDKWQPKEESEE